MTRNEFDIIRQYFRGLADNTGGVICGIGDDAAVLAIPPGHELVVSTDTLVSGVHFPAATAAADVGHKALAVNLSDLAAMAALPQWVTLALTLPEDDPEWLAGFCGGFAVLARETGVSLVGGDTTHGPLSITITVMGVVPAGTAVKRSGARPGDQIYVTGSLGGAGLALRRLLDGRYADVRNKRDVCLERLLRPRPRIATGLALRGIASAMIDISDGLAADLGHILEDSGCGAIVQLEDIPIAPELHELTRAEFWRTALTAGDDYELCFTAPVAKRPEVERLTQQSLVPITPIGEIMGSGLSWRNKDGSESKFPVTGYRHF
ncbi:MAG: thiamine-phosphate kinase [Gammaproteobacteria bacterium]|nr:MAG: thiamine-phosphate kinase [Gammaproteobacteria bacterium]